MGYGLSVTPKLKHRYFNDGVKEIDVTATADLAYNQRNAKSRIKIGVIPGYKRDLRIAKNSYFMITPYAKIKYNLTDKLEVFADAKLVYTSKKVLPLQQATLNAGLKYKW